MVRVTSKQNDTRTQTNHPYKFGPVQRPLSYSVRGHDVYHFQV